MQQQMQFYFEGREYTCRHDILNAYDIPPTGLHRLLEKRQPTTVQHTNRLYYLLTDVQDMLKDYDKK